MIAAKGMDEGLAVAQGTCDTGLVYVYELDPGTTWTCICASPRTASGRKGTVEESMR
jgi:hypothetical protein